ncbi:acyl- n-acyltransferase [Trichoderma arundinaceum]|uniref:Acyl-n-acyltransferase n=1 Tax=Trichoderma arundinaceum TaxID=490622 RepID=A0A395NRY6_TRIAR|nr:acyl- n-acyltransferase [Trichoderma arundinaceum]
MEDQERIKIRTTLPLIPPIDSRDEIHTARLILRPPRVSDVPALHKLRTQHEVMQCTPLGVDKTLEDTLRSLDKMLPPNDSKTYHFHVFQKDTGELVGKGGMHGVDGCHFGWPEAGYSFKHEHWGKGYATEFMTAYLENWWSLPRKEVEIEVDPVSVGSEGLEAGDAPVVERIAAVIDVTNKGSGRVLEKSGFTRFKEWKTLDFRDTHKGLYVDLAGFLSVAPTRERN